MATEKPCGARQTREKTKIQLKNGRLAGQPSSYGDSLNQSTESDEGRVFSHRHAEPLLHQERMLKGKI